MPKYEVKIAPPEDSFEVEAGSEEEAITLAEDLYIGRHNESNSVEVKELISA